MMYYYLNVHFQGQRDKQGPVLLHLRSTVASYNPSYNRHLERQTVGIAAIIEHSVVVVQEMLHFNCS